MARDDLVTVIVNRGDLLAVLALADHLEEAGEPGAYLLRRRYRIWQKQAKRLTEAMKSEWLKMEQTLGLNEAVYRAVSHKSMPLALDQAVWALDCEASKMRSYVRERFGNGRKS